jgi:hypothetical protein
MQKEKALITPLQHVVTDELKHEELRVILTVTWK